MSERTLRENLERALLQTRRHEPGFSDTSKLIAEALTQLSALERDREALEKLWKVVGFAEARDPHSVLRRDGACGECNPHDDIPRYFEGFQCARHTVVAILGTQEQP